MKKPDDALTWELIDNLSPCKNKYFYPISSLLFILIAITFPPDNYDGLLFVSSSSQVLNSHRVLYDATFLSCIITMISLFIKYAFIGFDPKYKKKLEAYSLDIHQYCKSMKKNYTPKKNLITWYLMLIAAIGFFFVPPVLEDNVKYNWIYRGNVYISFIGMYLVFLGVFSIIILSIINEEVYRNTS